LLTTKLNNDKKKSCAICDSGIIMGIAAFIRFFPLILAMQSHLRFDENRYWRLANMGILRPYSNHFFPPLWPYILSPIRHFTSDPFAGRTLGVLLSVLTCGCVFLIALKIFGRRAAIVSGLLCAANLEDAFFSHYLYSEIPLALIVTIATYLIFRSPTGLYKPSIVASSSFLLGIGFLCKQFAVYPLIALIIGLHYHRLFFPRVALAFTLFLLPFLLFSLKQKYQGEDSAVFVNLALRNACNLQGEHGMGPLIKKNPSTVFKKLLFNFRKKSASQMIEDDTNNFFRLWGPQSYPAFRLLRTNCYPPFRMKRFLAYGVMASYLFIMTTGIFGLCLIPGTIFKRYSVLCLLLLSLTSLFFVVAPRHRIPFMFIITIYSGAFLSNFKTAIQELNHWKKLIPLVFLLGIILISILSPHWVPN